MTSPSISLSSLSSSPSHDTNAHQQHHHPDPHEKEVEASYSSPRQVIGDCIICQYHPVDKEASLQLHKSVFRNDISTLQSILSCTSQHNINAQDMHGNTALHIAVMLSNVNATTLLLDCPSINVKVKNRMNSNVLAEAISIGYRPILALVYDKYAEQGHSEVIERTKQILDQLSHIPNFTIILDWKFHSWVPFVNKVLPNDRLRIYKYQNDIRIDTTLVDFNDNISQGLYKRGNVSYLLKVHPDSNTFNVYALDHINKYCQRLDHDKDKHKQKRELQMQQNKAASTSNLQSLNAIIAQSAHNNKSPHHLHHPTHAATELPLSDELETALDDIQSMPIASMRSVGKATFEQQYAGIWPFRHAKHTTIGKYTCNVYHLTGLNWKIRTRIEHMTKQDLAQQAAMSSMLRQGFTNTKNLRESRSNNRVQRHSNDSVNDEVDDESSELNKFESANAYEGTIDELANERQISDYNQSSLQDEVSQATPTPSQASSAGTLPFSRLRSTAHSQQTVNTSKHKNRKHKSKHRTSLEPFERTVTYEQYFENNHIITPTNSSLTSASASRNYSNGIDHHNVGASTPSHNNNKNDNTDSNHLHVPTPTSKSTSSYTNLPVSASAIPPTSMSNGEGTGHTRHSSGHNIYHGDDSNYIHLGRPIQLQEDTKKYSASVHMTQTFPLSIDTVSSILEIIAPHQQHIAKLHKFIKNKLPDGFPIQIELPILPTVKAVVTFVDYTADSTLSPTEFNIPKHYVEAAFHPLTSTNKATRDHL
jgi:hypothetical protein